MSLNGTFPTTGTIKITNNGNVSMPIGQAVSVAATWTSGWTDAQGKGVRVFYTANGGTTWTQIPRMPDLDSGITATGGTIWFPLQAAIAASGSDSNYVIGLYTGANAPTEDSQTRYTELGLVDASYNLTRATLGACASKMLTGAFANIAGHNAAPGYAYSSGTTIGLQAFIADDLLGALQDATARASTGRLYSTAELQNVVTMFATTAPVGNTWPWIVGSTSNSDLTYVLDSNGNRNWDGDYGVPIMCWAAWKRSADLTQFNTYKVNMSAVLDAMPVSSASTPWGSAGPDGYGLLHVGGGTGATATAVMVAGIITSVSVTAGGTGYSTGTTAYFGTGGAWGTCAVNSSGAITAVTVRNGGAGYGISPPVSFVAAMPFGFYDGTNYVGYSAIATVFYIVACQKMAEMYTAAGDATNAVKYAGLANTSIAALQNTSGPVYDATTKLLMRDTGPAFLDVGASSLAAAMGFIPSAGPSIAAYLAANIDPYGNAIFNNVGFARQILNPTPDTYRFTWWAWHVGYALATCMLYSQTAFVQTQVNNYLYSGFESYEFTGNPADIPPAHTGSPKLANMVSPFAYYYLGTRYPACYTNTSSSFTGVNYSTVFPVWDDKKTNQAREYSDSKNFDVAGMTVTQNTTSGLVELVASANSEQRLVFPFYTAAPGNITLQATMQIKNYNNNTDTAADDMMAGISAILNQSGNNKLSTGARGRDADRGNGWNLNNVVSWGNATAVPSSNILPTTPGTPGQTYNVKMRLIAGTTAYKFWVPATAQPSGYSGSYASGVTVASTNTDLGVILLSFLETYKTDATFTNILVNYDSGADPTIASNASGPSTASLPSVAPGSSSSRWSGQISAEFYGSQIGFSQMALSQTSF